MDFVVALVAAATQAVSRRKGAKQSQGTDPGKTFCDLSVGTPLGAHGVQRPIWRDCFRPFLPLTALIPLPASVPAHAGNFRGGGRIPPTSPGSLAGHGALHADRARAAWAGRRSPSSLFCRLLSASAGFKTHHGGLSIGARTRGGLGVRALFQVPRRAAGWGGCMHSHPAWAPAQGLASSATAKVCVSHPNLGPLVWPERW